jgi:hypothetical protein
VKEMKIFNFLNYKKKKKKKKKKKPRASLAATP